MATYTSGFMTTFLPRISADNVSSVNENLVWSVMNGSFINEPGSTHNGERVFSAGTSYRVFAVARNYALCGMEARSLFGGGGTAFIYTLKNGTTVIARLQADTGGKLSVLSGATVIATESVATMSSSSTFYTIEFAYANITGANACSCEVRINGIQISALTTTDQGGALAKFTQAGGTAGTIDRVTLQDTGSAVTPVVYWYYQKNGTSLWASNATPPGDTFALSADFVGQKKRAWIVPNSAGNYTQGASNWPNGVGTYPTNIADAGTGFDGDASYIKNVTSGSNSAADKISHHYTALPGTAVNIGFVQRTVLARWDQVSTSDTIRMGVRSPAGAATPNTDYYFSQQSGSWTTGTGTTADEALSNSYSAGTPFFSGSCYYPLMPSPIATKDLWTATTLNPSNLEGLLEQRAFV